MNIKKRIIALVLFVALSFSTFFAMPAKAVDVAHIGVSIPNLGSTIISTLTTLKGYAKDVYDKIEEHMASQVVTYQKMAALLAVQTATTLVIGDGKDGAIIRDFNDYLFVSPQQRAMLQMNSFFNTVSRGRLSSLNYEGVGMNYDAYLVAQARQAIAGQAFSTNLQDQVSDPTQMFSTGNMKGIMTYMQCANNPMCYTLVSQEKYKQELSKQQELAKVENVNGFKPKKTNGRIVQPAALAQSALSQMDQLGTQVIMNADSKDKEAAIAQIWTGAGISVTARLTNYGISDKEGRERIINQNNQFPFSLSYSSNGGIGISAGGVTVNTGTGAFASQLQIGNTCAAAYGSIDKDGATVEIQGKKYTCPKTGTQTSGTKPSVSVTEPTINTTP